MLSSVLFDMDGLMFDTEKLNMRSWAEAGKKHGVVITEDVMREYIGLSLAETRRRMTEKFGADFDFDAVRTDRIALSREWIIDHGLPIKPGLYDLLAWLSAKKIPRAIATSSGRDIVDFYLSHASLRDKFDAVVTGESVSHGKPAPDIFLKAADELGVTNTARGDCVVLEDSYNGIIAARAAGMKPIMIPDLLPPTPRMTSLAYRVLNSLSDVAPVLEELVNE